MYMTTHATGNPVGSTEVKDLFDNSQNFDHFATDRTVTEYPDRLGVNRLTMYGMEQAFNAFLQNSQFEYPPLAYAAGVVIQRPTQLVDRAGQLYRALLPATFPITLSGDWVTDAPLLTATSDASLRQDLSDLSSVSLGAALIGRGLQVVTNITALRALLKTTPSRFARTTGYVAANDGGGGMYYLDAADTTTADNGGTVIVATDGGRWKLLHDGEIDVRQFGARGDGSTNDTAAIIAAAAASSLLRVAAGTYLIGTTGTIAEGAQIVFNRGASFSVSSGVTLTIRSRVDAGRAQIFSGAGVVLGLRRVLPEWFGAVGNSTTNDSPAFQAAQNCLEGSSGSPGTEAVMEISDRTYGFGAQVNITPTNKFRIVWRGVGNADSTYLRGLATFSGTSVLRFVPAAANSSSSDGLFENFRIVPQTAGSGATRGITIGDGATTLQGGAAAPSLVFRNVNVYEFSRPWYVRNARLCKFERCSGTIASVAGGRCLSLVSLAAGEFTGDCDFDQCQFENQVAGANVVYMEASTTGTTSGVRFNGCIHYGGSITLSVLSGGRASDIWWNPGCQFDVIKQNCIQIGCDGANSKIFNVQMLNCYYNGALIGTFTVFNVYTANGGRIRGLNVDGNFFNQSIGDIVYVNGADISGVSVSKNQFCDAGAGTGVTIGSGVMDSVVEGNRVGRNGMTTTLTFLVVTLSGANRYAIRNNCGGGVTTTIVADNAAGANKIVDGNF